MTTTGPRTGLAAFTQGWREPGGRTVAARSTAELSHDLITAQHTILGQASAEADLLISGARSDGGFASVVLGSVSQHAIPDATGPGLVVKNPTRA